MNLEYVVIIISLLLLLYLLYSKYTSKPKYDLYNGSYWANPTDDTKSYRLGDLIYKFSLDHTYLTNVKNRWPASIGDKYLRYVGFPQKYDRLRYDIIDRILLEETYDKPDKHTLVIHLRLGDTITMWKQGKVDFWMKDNNHYVKDPEYYEHLVPILQQIKGIHAIDIVAGAHVDDDLQVSSEYLDHIVKIFNQHYKVTVKITNNPDKDFYYMCNSSYFCPSGGGYSNLVTAMVRKYKNQIIE
jgi:hypothetical protein